MKFHGEYHVTLKIGVVVEAESLEAAEMAVKELQISVDDEDDVLAREWDVEPISVSLFEGAQ